MNVSSDQEGVKPQKLHIEFNNLQLAVSNSKARINVLHLKAKSQLKK